MDTSALPPPLASPQPPDPSPAVRPVLAALVGPGSRPRASIIAAILAGLGAGAIELALSQRMTGSHADAAQRQLNGPLSQGLSVLVHLGDRRGDARRVLLDAAARHFAATLALVRGGSHKTAGGLIAQLAGEGWTAAVVLR